MVYTCTIDTPLGPMTAASHGGGLTGLWFKGQKYFPDLEDCTEDDRLPVFALTRAYLVRYFSGEPVSPLPGVRLAPRGSPFQKEVWSHLLKIPTGDVATYKQIAASIARARGMTSMSAQAVGGAVGHNPISILIPCHRVVGTDGSLTGYAGGLERKEALLRIEKVNLGDDRTGRRTVLLKTE